MSENLSKYENAFKEAFNLKNENLENLKYQSIEKHCQTKYIKEIS